jgi:hypothetical protein
VSGTGRRVPIFGIALALIVAAVAWVSVSFTDRSFDCGTALGAARHGTSVPALLTSPMIGPRHAGLFDVSREDAHFVTLCSGQARARLAEAGGAVAIALLAVVLALRPRHEHPAAALS